MKTIFRTFTTEPLITAALLVTATLAPNLAFARSPKIDRQFTGLAMALNFQGAADVKVVSDQTLRTADRFQVHDLTLHNRIAGDIHLRLRLPIDSGPHPALFLAHGLDNTDATALFDKMNDDVVLAELQYPFNGARRGVSLISDVLKSSWKSELQMAVALDWLQNQPNVAPDKISVINVSLGTFLAPLAIRLAQTVGFQSYATVFAFGGADLVPLVHQAFDQFGSDADYKNIATSVTQSLQFAEPAQHLAYLKGRFLVIEGKDDQVIPAASQQKLIAGLADPKQVVMLDAGHINTHNQKLLEETIHVIHNWLEANGALSLPKTVPAEELVAPGPGAKL